MFLAIREILHPLGAAISLAGNMTLEDGVAKQHAPTY